MPVRGSPLQLSDDELQAQAQVDPERDMSGIRQWKDRYMPSPFGLLLEASEDPNDPALPEDEDPVSDGGN